MDIQQKINRNDVYTLCFERDTHTKKYGFTEKIIVMVLENHNYESENISIFFEKNQVLDTTPNIIKY